MIVFPLYILVRMALGRLFLIEAMFSLFVKTMSIKIAALIITL